MELIIFDKETGIIKFKMMLCNIDTCKKIIKGKNLQIGFAQIEKGDEK